MVQSYSWSKAWITFVTHLLLKQIMSGRTCRKISIGGRNITNLKFADDINALAEEVVVVDLLFYIHGKHLRSCRDGQLT